MARFPETADPSSQAVKKGAGVVGGPTIMSTAVFAIAFPPAGALIATGGALGVAGASAAVASAAAKDQEAEAMRDPRAAVYLGELKVCLAERGVVLVESPAAGGQKK